MQTICETKTLIPNTLIISLHKKAIIMLNNQLRNSFRPTILNTVIFLVSVSTDELFEPSYRTGYYGKNFIIISAINCQDKTQNMLGAQSTNANNLLNYLRNIIIIIEMLSWLEYVCIVTLLIYFSCCHTGQAPLPCFSLAIWVLSFNLSFPSLSFFLFWTYCTKPKTHTIILTIHHYFYFGYFYYCRIISF